VPLVEQELLNLPEHLNGKMADAQHFLCPKTPVLSIYPKHYSPEVRAHLYRMAYARDGRSDFKAHMLWTTMRMDMNNNNWIPIHFVPVLSIEISERKTDEYVLQSTS
jgi:hypothetical protein